MKTISETKAHRLCDFFAGPAVLLVGGRRPGCGHRE